MMIFKKINNLLFQYRADLDGIRGLAVISVIIYHFFPEYLPGGFWGVDIFFVLSGYLISRIIITQLNSNSFSFFDFYIRRIRRIFPALITVLLATLIIGHLFLTPIEYKKLGKHLLGGATFISNFILWHEAGYFDNSATLKPLLHLWSLSVEEQFYLLWPIALYCGFKNGWLSRLILLTIGLSFVLNVVLVYTAPIAAFYFPISRFWELVLGAAITFYKFDGLTLQSALRRSFRSSIASWIGLLLICFSCFFITANHKVPGFWAFLPVCGTLFLICGQENWVNRRILSNYTLAGIGKISYPLYLWHWPIFSFINITSPSHPSFGLRVFAVILGVFLSYLTYVFIESPIRFSKNYIIKPQIALSSVLLIIGSIGLTDYLCDGWPSRFPGEISAYFNYSYDYSKHTDAQQMKCWLPQELSENGFSEECYPSSLGKKTILIWGDSHAACLYPGLKKIFGAQFNVAQYTTDSCSAVNDCKANAHVLSLIKQHKPNVVILFAAWNRYNFDVSILSNKLDELIKALKKAGVEQIVVMGPIPQWTVPLPQAIYSSYIRNFLYKLPTRMSEYLETKVFSFDEGISHLVQAKSISYISLIKLLCTEKGCLTQVSPGPSGMITPDYGHLSITGSEYIAKQLLVKKIIV
ncbi:acyltransferase family protein [Legionella sainthelensi]|uniref:acyltransferase family protein n=1 Tax=Legionella sainthelensi TaxID=28087 RepID=UPI000E20A090|nr:acyltransferase family protein [Legionella sainthelensi]